MFIQLRNALAIATVVFAASALVPGQALARHGHGGGGWGGCNDRNSGAGWGGRNGGFNRSFNFNRGIGNNCFASRRFANNFNGGGWINNRRQDGWGGRSGHHGRRGSRGLQVNQFAFGHPVHGFNHPGHGAYHPVFGVNGKKSLASRFRNCF